MFTYSQLKIDSAIPLQEILDYFAAIGAVRSPRDTFLYCGLEIKVLPRNDVSFPCFKIPRHEIIILNGACTTAEDFLTNFRLHFLSAGG